jgi:hypothetical protein
MDDFTRLEFEENTVDGFEEILTKGIDLCEVSLPKEGDYAKV